MGYSLADSLYARTAQAMFVGRGAATLTRRTVHRSEQVPVLGNWIDVCSFTYVSAELPYCWRMLGE